MHYQYQQRETETFQRLPEQQNQTWAAVAGAAIGAVGSFASANAQKKASRTATPQIDIGALNALVNQQSESNARRSLALEQQLSPETYNLRRETAQNLLANARRGTPEQDAAMQSVLDQLRAVASPAFADSLRSRTLESAAAQAGNDLALGGQLPQDVRNEIIRRGISTAGRVGGGNLGTARAIVPRDLGISSLALRDQRLQNAGNLGQAEAAYNTNRATTPVNAGNVLANLLASLAGGRTQSLLGQAAFGQSLQPPQVGLSPSSVADIYSNNLQAEYNDKLNRISGNNAANQSYLQGLGSIFGGIQSIFA